MQAGRPAEALAHLGRALALDPRNLTVVAALGQAFHAAGQPVNALKAFDQVIAAGKAGNPRKAGVPGETERAHRVLHRLDDPARYRGRDGV